MSTKLSYPIGTLWGSTLNKYSVSLRSFSANPHAQWLYMNTTTLLKTQGTLYPALYRPVYPRPKTKSSETPVNNKATTAPTPPRHCSSYPQSTPLSETLSETSQARQRHSTHQRTTDLTGTSPTKVNEPFAPDCTTLHYFALMLLPLLISLRPLSFSLPPRWQPIFSGHQKIPGLTVL